MATLNKEDNIMVYCAGGYRSMIACSILAANGFEKTINVEGGYSKLSQQDVPLTLGESCSNYEMEKARVNLIDVRTPDEFNAGSVPNAINFPLNEVVNRLDELKELQPMLVFCAAGVRSQKAIDFLIANGVNQVENGGGWLDVNARLNSL